MPDYRSAGVVDPVIILSFLQNKGYTNVLFSGIGRHITGTLSLGEALYFFKVSSTAGISERTQNEAIFYKNFTDEQHKMCLALLFSVPTLLESGFINPENFFIISQYIKGDEAFQRASIVRDRRIENYELKSITDMAFICANTRELFRKTSYGNKHSHQRGVAEFMEKIHSWTLPGDPHMLSEIQEECVCGISQLRPGVNHGDFNPWHILKKKDQFYIIDWEHFDMGQPDFFDAIYCFHRIATEVASLELATHFLTQFIQKLNPADKEYFIQIHRPLIASRIIAGFYDASLKKRDLKFHEQLAKKFQEHAPFFYG